MDKDREKDLTYSEKIPTPGELYAFYEEMGWEPGFGKTPEELFKAIRGSYKN